MCYGQVTCKINCTEWREHSNHPSKKEKKTLNHESKCATEEVKKQKLASLFHDKIWLLFCSHCWYYIIHWWLRQVLGQCLLNKQQGITYNFRSCHSLASPYFFKMRPQRKSLLESAGSDAWEYMATSCSSQHKTPTFSVWISAHSGGGLHRNILCTMMVCCLWWELRTRGQKDYLSPWILIKKVKITPTYNCILS